MEPEKLDCDLGTPGASNATPSIEIPEKPPVNQVQVITMNWPAPSDKDKEVKNISYEDLLKLPIEEFMAEKFRRYGNFENRTEACLHVPKSSKEKLGLKEEDGYIFVDDEEYYWKKEKDVYVETETVYDDAYWKSLGMTMDTDSSDFSETEEAVSQESTAIEEAEFDSKKRPNNEGEDCDPVKRPCIIVADRDIM